MFTKVTNPKHIESIKISKTGNDAFEDTVHLVYDTYGSRDQFTCMLKSGVRPALQVLALTLDPEVIRSVYHTYRESRYPADATKPLAYSLDIHARRLFLWFHDDRRMSDLFLILTENEKAIVQTMLGVVADVGSENGIDKYMLIYEFLRKIIMVPNATQLSPHSEIHLYVLANMILQINNDILNETGLLTLARGATPMPDKIERPLVIDQSLERIAYG
jgi:hypothetical protein